MRVGVAGGVLRISNVDNADFDLPFCNRSERAFGASDALLLDDSPVSPPPEQAARAKTIARAISRASALVNFFIFDSSKIFLCYGKAPEARPLS